MEKIRVIKMIILFCLLFLQVPAQDQVSAVRLKQFNLQSAKAAIEGYDPVAYFRLNKAVKGSQKHSYQYAGVNYHFSSAENLTAFKKEPEKYEPQYGGWCAYAMGNDGSKVEVDPETFRILDGRLYLFYNSFFNNTLKTWLKDESGLRQKADQHWKKFVP